MKLFGGSKPDHPLADSAGHGSAKDKRGNEVPEGGPEDGAARTQDAGGNDGGDGIGSVMPAIGKIKDQRDGHDHDDQLKTTHGETLPSGA